MKNRHPVLAMRNPAFDVSPLDARLSFIDGLRIEQRIELSGGFSDRAGGAYLLRAATPDEARASPERDPLRAHGASKVTAREWNAS